jgi:hypothetical protein
MGPLYLDVAGHPDSMPLTTLHVYKVFLPRGIDSLPGQDGSMHVVMGAIDDVVNDIPLLWHTFLNIVSYFAQDHT